MNFSLATCVVLCFAFVAEAALVTQHCLAGLLPTSGKQQMHSAFLLCLCIRLFLSLLNCHYLGAWVFSPSFSLSCHVGEGSEWEKWIFSPCPRSNPYKIISLKCEKGATCHWFKATKKNHIEEYWLKIRIKRMRAPHFMHNIYLLILICMKK